MPDSLNRPQQTAPSMNPGETVNHRFPNSSFFTKMHPLLCFAVLLVQPVSGETNPPADADTAVSTAMPDTSAGSDMLPATDSSAVPTDTVPADDTASAITVTDTAADSQVTVHRPSDQPGVSGDEALQQQPPLNTGETDDTTVIADGNYFAFGAGWSLGSFELLSLWENAQPDSLHHLGLADTSFRIPFDSAADNGDLTDTALLTYSIKEAPAVYTMSFPLHLSFLAIRGATRMGFSVSGSWMRKVFTSTIAAANDTLARKVDFKESINIYSLFLSFVWGRSIPEQYFTIEGVERSCFTAALDISPLIAVNIRRKATTSAPGERFANVRQAIAEPSSRFMHGGAAALRLGITMLKRLNAASATDFGVWYSIQGYGYFLDDGNRVGFTDIDPASSRKDRPLYWVSNRLELTFSLMHRLQH